jgi:hypothetical protein
MFEPMSSRPRYSRGKKQINKGGHEIFDTSMANSERGQRIPTEQHLQAALKKAENAVKMEEIEAIFFKRFFVMERRFLR